MIICTFVINVVFVVVVVVVVVVHVCPTGIIGFVIINSQYMYI
jgi:hypothetical protein